MISKELDPDVVRWGLHHLNDCTLSNSGSLPTITRYDTISSSVESVREGYIQRDTSNVENDEVIAHALQEELRQVAAAAVETAGSSYSGEDHLQASILAQDWLGPSKRHSSNEQENAQDETENATSCSNSGERLDGDDLAKLFENMATDGYSLDGRLNSMVSIPHVPKINGEIPSVDEATSDHQRLLDRLQVYDLVELKVQGDGNCQFRALSDQFYRTSDHHKFVRSQIVLQLKSHPEMYEGYVPMPYSDYLKKMTKNGEWGDHVTLQAVADSYGLKIFVLTSFKDTCYIEIIPHIQKSERVICLSFWAEVHYNSIYPSDDMPTEARRKKKWWAVLKRSD